MAIGRALEMMKLGQGIVEVGPDAACFRSTGQRIAIAPDGVQVATHCGAHGGLSKATRRNLASLAREMATKGSITVTAEIRLRPGARLMREWRGKTHTVIVRDEGFELAGTLYPSLTQIAHLITGAHWSGPRFFGLRRKPLSGGGVSGAPVGLTADRAL